MSSQPNIIFMYKVFQHDTINQPLISSFPQSIDKTQTRPSWTTPESIYIADSYTELGNMGGHEHQSVCEWACVCAWQALKRGHP
jgi:hypothetical protein